MWLMRKLSETDLDAFIKASVNNLIYKGWRKPGYSPRKRKPRTSDPRHFQSQGKTRQLFSTIAAGNVWRCGTFFSSNQTQRTMSTPSNDSTPSTVMTGPPDYSCTVSPTLNIGFSLGSVTQPHHTRCYSHNLESMGL